MICSGLKTVENRTWNTDYRGRIYIHSSGQKNYYVLAGYKLPDRLDRLYDLWDKSGVSHNVPDKKDLMSKFKKNGIAKEMKECVDFEFGVKGLQEKMCDYYGVDIFDDENKDAIDKAFKNKIYFKAFAIIGHVDLVDVVEDSDSVWAEKCCYNWILDNPVLYDEPVINVKGKLRFFDVSNITLPD